MPLIPPCNKYKLPSLAFKDPQGRDPAHLPSLVSLFTSRYPVPQPNCCPQLSRNSSTFSPPRSPHAQLHARPYFSPSCLPEFCLSSKDLITDQLLRNPSTDPHLFWKLPQPADDTHLNFLHRMFLQSSLVERKECGLWS